MSRYSDARVGQLERAIYGRRVTTPDRDRLGHRVDNSARRAASLLLSWRRLPYELAGSRTILAARIAVQGLLAGALFLLVAGAAGWIR